MSVPSLFEQRAAKPNRTGQDEHLDRMTEAAVAALTEIGFVEAEAVLAVSTLREKSAEYCVCCGYKRKAATGATPAPAELTEIDGLDQITRNPQRDGDDGDTDKRMRHDLHILRSLFQLGPMTDEEIWRVTRIYHDSAKGARANLVKGGWVRQSVNEGKRLSGHGRPMTVWELTPEARSRLTEMYERKERQ